MKRGKRRGKVGKGGGEEREEEAQGQLPSVRHYRDPGVAEGLVHTLQVVRQQTQQTGAHKDSTPKTADHAQQGTAASSCKTKAAQHRSPGVVSYHQVSYPKEGRSQISSPFSPQHEPAPLTMQTGTNPKSRVTLSMTTRAATLNWRAGPAAWPTCSAAISPPAGSGSEPEVADE